MYAVLGYEHVLAPCTTFIISVYIAPPWKSSSNIQINKEVNEGLTPS